ncbi:MAG TPA: glycosyltransferase family 4 protein [Candidatus Limnocylindria bacterium]|nr:glycosyltransferase family 4 protein [Candidatus Limnocylindria bacterium]
MKIAQCLEYPIQQHGGTEVLVRELIAGLAPRHEIVLVSDDDSHTIRNSPIGTHIQEHLRWQPERATLQTSKKLAEDLAQRNLNLAHFHFGGTFGWGSRSPNFSPPIHLRRQGTPCLATNHGVFGVLEGYIGAQRSLATKLALLPLAWFSRMQLILSLQAEVAVSMADYRALCRRYWPARGRFRQVYHSRIHENEPVIVLPRKKIILCAGTIGPRKGQPYLAHAFARIVREFPDWNLVFIGRSGDECTATELNAIMQRAELHSRITWIQNCSDAELRHWFQSVEIFAMPSLHEGLGLTLQEALYHGCACIASRIGGIPDLIQHGDNGILVERANVEELADGLGRLMRDGERRHQLQARARESVLGKNMTAERMVARYSQLYAEVLSSHGK